MSESSWMREAWALIATCREVEQEGDREQWTVDGMPATDGQVVELAVTLGKQFLAQDSNQKSPPPSAHSCAV